MADIEVRGLDALQDKFDRIRREMPTMIQTRMRTAVLYVQSEIPPYPAPPAGSTYTRTGTLGRVITAFGGSGSVGGGTPLSRVETLDGGAVGYIGGRLEYINEVIGEGEQKAVHAGRWYTLQGVLRKSWSGVVNIFRQGVQELIR